MQFLLVLIGWCLLFALAWPLALAVLLFLPLLWLLSIPFRVVGVVLDAAIAFLRALLFLPARLLGHK